jgi:hypothetical protein
MIFAPFSASLKAIARPNPDEAPVTNATLSFKGWKDMIWKDKVDSSKIQNTKICECGFLLVCLTEVAGLVTFQGPRYPVDGLI